MPKPTAVGAKAIQVDPVVVDVNVRIQALAIREAEGRYSIVVSALPGCYSAAEGWLESRYELRKAEALTDSHCHGALSCPIKPTFSIDRSRIRSLTMACPTSRVPSRPSARPSSMNMGEL